MKWKTSAHRFLEKLDFEWKIASFFVASLPSRICLDTTRCTFSLRPIRTLFIPHTFLAFAHFSFCSPIETLFSIIHRRSLIVLSLLIYRHEQSTSCPCFCIHWHEQIAAAPIGFKFLISLFFGIYIMNASSLPTVHTEHHPICHWSYFNWTFTHFSHFGSINHTRKLFLL